MKRRHRLQLTPGVTSHRGLVREENQDRHGLFETRLGRVFAVADGMGGHLDGARAAGIVIAVLESELERAVPRADPADSLRRAASAASAAVHRESADSAAAGARMGATLVTALVRDRRVVIAHAGDSRAYLFRDARLRALTRDHTVVQRMVEKGILSPEEARHHPDAGIVRRALGKADHVELEVAEPLSIEKGDRLLLCSDGLCGYVDDEAIAAGLDRRSGAQAAADALVQLALAKGGEDNVTVLVVDALEAPEEEAASRDAKRSYRERFEPFGGRGRGAWIGLSLALGAAALGLILAFWLVV